MKKMYLGFAILAVLLCASLYNVHYIDGKISALLEYVDSAGELAGEKDFASAVDVLQEAIALWHDMDGYTHVLIRHGEADSADDAFYDYLDCLLAEDPGSAGEREKLREHLSTIAAMERVSLGTIF